MHPDWQSVRRLLVVDLLDQNSQAVLHQILPLLQQSLPQASIAVLSESPNPLPKEQISALSIISLPFPFSDLIDHANRLIQILQERSFDAVILFTLPQQSPYLIAYCCYLADIEIRVGQSCEFGGGVLSHCIQPSLDPIDPLEYQLYLLRSVGLAIDETSHFVSPDSISAQSAGMAMI